MADTAETIDIDKLESRTLELRGKAMETADKLNELRDAKDKTEDWARELRNTSALLNSFDQEMSITERMAASEHAKRAREAARQEIANGPRAATADTSAPGFRSLGDYVVEAEGYSYYAKRDAKGNFQADLNIPARELRVLLDSGTGDTASAGNFVPLASPKLNARSIDEIRLFLEDLLPSGDTSYPLVPYIRELSPRTNETGATVVAEGGAKPEVEMQFVRVDAPIRKVAAWLPATDEILSDAPTLRSYVDARLAYMLKLRAEAELLNGDGTGAHILGILQTTGIQTKSAVTGDPATTLALAMAKIELVDGVADGVVLNPSDYWTMVTRRTAGSGEYDSDDLPFGVGPNGSWGLPVVRTRALAAGTALVGAFKLGAMVWNREGISIRLGDQHSDWFIYNKVAILAERRLGLEVDRPDYFVNTTIA